jgi:hypothetical protein
MLNLFEPFLHINLDFYHINFNQFDFFNCFNLIGIAIVVEFIFNY